MNRRRFLAALGAACAGAGAYAGLVEPRRLEVTHHTIEPRPGSARARLVVAQVTDLHIHGLGHLHHAIAEHLAEIRPHLVVFTGDSVDDPAGVPAFGCRCASARFPNWRYSRCGYRYLVSHNKFIPRSKDFP